MESLELFISWSKSIQINVYKIIKGVSDTISVMNAVLKTENFKGWKFQVWNTHSKIIQYYL